MKLNLDELYDLLLPALETKEIQLRRNDYLGLTKNDIWDYLVNNVWEEPTKIHINKLVSDIIDCDNSLINSYKEM